MASRVERRSLAWLVGPILLAVAANPAAGTFTTFESGHVRPLAMTPDGTRLLAVNTPDDRLEIFDVDASGGLTHRDSVVVGLEPVAVAVRSDGEAWVVNHLSDSISIVDLGPPPRVVRTLLVGDEPRDIVFAGPGGNRAFITTAHRGQNTPIDMAVDLVTPGIGRADVWVFDATNLGSTLGGTPLTRVVLFADTPRALATSADGSTVYAAAFQSGNRTTPLNMGLVCDGGESVPPCNVSGTIMPGGLPSPNTNVGLVPQPEVGLVVRFDGTDWLDELGRSWNNAVRFALPDRDVFTIDANATPPVETGSFAGVGTLLFAMAVNPASGAVYVANTEARNEVRFEGPGVFGGSSVRGHLHEARVTVLSGAAVTPRHLNKHIDYGVVPSAPGTAQDSLATPVSLAVDADGSTLYVAALGSGTVGVLSTAALEDDTFVPDAGDHIDVQGGGPSGLLLDDARNRLYVSTRFDDGISVIDTTARVEVAHVALYNPEPASVVDGRRFLYDARLTSSNGEASCAACHAFGDFDSLAWDLGNPDDPVLDNQNPLRPGLPSSPDFHPMKGPMATQSLRGMANHGPMHWRGDRTGGLDAPSVQPNGGAFNEAAAFKKFNVAFAGLLGRSGPLTTAEMQAFTDFILQVTYPPNPVRALDNALTAAQQAGRTFYFNADPSDTIGSCNFCHVLNPGSGFFGTDGFSIVEPQAVKVPHLRNAYQKVGMFGMPAVPGTFGFNVGSNGFQGDQVRGVGFTHDGSVDTLFRFFNGNGFNQGGMNTMGFASDLQRRQVEQFVLAFDSNLAPIVGQQITIDSTNAATVGPRIDLLVARAGAGECDLVMHGVYAGESRGAYRLANGMIRSDRIGDPLTTEAVVRAGASTPGREVTYSCAPPGSGQRLGVDRDQDGYFDRDELDAGSDPADPSSIPPGATTSTTSTTIATTSTTTSTLPTDYHAILGRKLLLTDPVPSLPSRRKLRVTAQASPSPAPLPANPGASGATLVVIVDGFRSSFQIFDLAGGAAWRATGSSGFKFTGTGIVRGVTIKRSSAGKFSWKVKADGPMDLVPPNFGAQARVFLQVGSDVYCTTFSGAVFGFTVDTDLKLLAGKQSTAGSCP